MGEVKFTPGPWRIGRAISTEAVYVMADKDIIGSVFNSDDKGSNPNARLIAASPAMHAEILAEIQLLEDAAVQIEEWAYESVRGGWSTHQVDRNKRLASQFRQRQIDLRRLIAKAESQ